MYYDVPDIIDFDCMLGIEANTCNIKHSCWFIQVFLYNIIIFSVICFSFIDF